MAHWNQFLVSSHVLGKQLSTHFDLILNQFQEFRLNIVTKFTSLEATKLWSMWGSISESHNQFQINKKQLFFGSNILVKWQVAEIELYDDMKFILVI